jgi:hypothetical protein
MVRRVIESEAMEAHRHVGAITYPGDGHLQSVYEPVQDFDNADGDDVARYHERMTRMSREGFSTPSPPA